jgi:hypothetical protein
MTPYRFVPPTLRVAIVRPDGVDSHEERTRLLAAALERTEEDTNEMRHSVTWKSSNSSVDAALTIKHDLSTNDFACAQFTGPDRVILAVQLISLLNYMPIELMHRTARTSNDIAIRCGALNLLTQFYCLSDLVSHWDTNIQETVDFCSDDTDPGVRMQALVAEIQGNPQAALARIEGQLQQEQSHDYRTTLLGLATLTERLATTAPQVPDVPQGHLQLHSDNLSIPVFRIGPIQNVVTRLAGVVEPKQKDLVSAGESAGLDRSDQWTHLEAVNLRAELGYYVDDVSKVGCAYFSGPDQFALAAGIAWAVRYIPSDLAELAIEVQGASDVAALASRALQLAALKKPLRADPAFSAPKGCADDDN